MEKEFTLDQEVVVVNVSDESLPEEIVEEQFNDEDYASTDEGAIDWSTL